MDARETTRRVGTEVSKAIAEAGFTPEVVAEAIGLDQSEMEAHLAGAAEFSVSQLIEVGGLLRRPAGSFLAGAA